MVTLSNNFNNDPAWLALRLKEEAARLGFSACGIARAEEVDEATRSYLSHWLASGCYADMGYLATHFEKRCDPRLLVEGCKSLVVVALNYYPAQRIPAHHPQLSVYAYGDDYHDVMREKLQQLHALLQQYAACSGRCFCDTAPLLERYWAVRAGIGFVGKNRQLILPNEGSYFFLGVIATTVSLLPDTPFDRQSCLGCNRCITACPTQALSLTKGLDARRCLAYHTIENRGEIPVEIAEKMGDRLFGCDTCQQVCPHNNEAVPTIEPRYALRPELLTLDTPTLEGLTSARFSELFRGSPIKRTKYAGLMRNLFLARTRKI